MRQSRSGTSSIIDHPSSIALVACFLVLELSVAGHARELVRITEFMAVNHTGLDDEDRDESDWIEIHNAGVTAVDLEGWYLTDRVGNPTMWRFPAVTLEPDGYLIVFASGKDRRDPAGELHTNFRLSGSGEYLGLVRPDGFTVASEFFPAFPIQAPDISYGLVDLLSQQVLLAEGSPARALVPGNNMLEGPPGAGGPRPWTLPEFDDASWQAGTTGVGYGYPRMIGLDVSAMRHANETVYIRVPFVVDDPSAIRTLTLRIRCENGMVAYLNGHEVARHNAPPPGSETWNSRAPEQGPSVRFPGPRDFTISRRDLLRQGANLLAVQGLNHGVDSPSLLIVPELLAGVAEGESSLHYFPHPTPGRPNSPGVETIGPIITDVSHEPRMPTMRSDLQITVRITQSFDPVVSAQLRYRVMFGPEVAVALRDDGKSGDGDQGDGIFGARIPADAYGAGQMVRWYITATDAAGRMSRFPPFRNPAESPQYCGTVVADPSLKNPLPVLHWFIQDQYLAAANTDAGTQCSIFYNGEFYDNVWVNIHGQSSRGFPKKSYDFDFHPGYNFRWAPGERRVSDIHMLTTYPDKAQMRNILAYETFRDADCPYHFAFAVRVQQNGAFWGTAHMVEKGKWKWLDRLGVNIEGALYKMYSTFTSPSGAMSGTQSGAQKKTRKDEDHADLLEFFHGVSLTGEARRRYLYDNVNIPQVVNFLAALTLTGNTDCCHKNYYFYRDTGRSDEWQMWPWDVDLSFGRRWISSMTYWDHRLIVDTPLFVGNNNRLPQAIFGTPELRQMYLRRLRTLMDELLKPPGTPPDALYYEPRIDELAAQIAPDAALDAAKWNSHAWGNGSTAPNYPQSLPEAVAELKYSYLPERRRQLYNGLAPGAAEIPGPQPPGTMIAFASVMTRPVHDDPDEEYIELLNPNRFAVDISGWTLSTGTQVQTPFFTFRGGTVIPAGGSLYVAANRTAFRVRRRFPTGGQGLFVVGDCALRLADMGEILELTDRYGITVASIGTRLVIGSSILAN
jgi:hypothetical protein